MTAPKFETQRLLPGTDRPQQLIGLSGTREGAARTVSSEEPCSDTEVSGTEEINAELKADRVARETVTHLQFITMHLLSRELPMPSPLVKLKLLLK